MMSFSRTYETITQPLDMVYFDASNDTVAVSNVTLSATMPGEVLRLPSGVTGTFNNSAFPLSSDDFLTPITGDLVLTYTGDFSTGIYTLSLLLTTGLWQGLGSLMASGAGYGVGGQGEQHALPLIYLSVLRLTTTDTIPIVPDSAWH